MKLTESFGLSEFVLRFDNWDSEGMISLWIFIVSLIDNSHKFKVSDISIGYLRSEKDNNVSPVLTLIHDERDYTFQWTFLQETQKLEQEK